MKPPRLRDSFPQSCDRLSQRYDNNMTSKCKNLFFVALRRREIKCLWLTFKSMFHFSIQCHAETWQCRNIFSFHKVSNSTTNHRRNKCFKCSSFWLDFLPDLTSGRAAQMESKSALAMSLYFATTCIRGKLSNKNPFAWKSIAIRLWKAPGLQSRSVHHKQVGP